MPNDAFTIRAAAIELADSIIGAKINKITQQARDCFTLHLYRAGKSMKLLICGGANDARIHLTDTERPALPAPTGFAMTLRKYFAGGIITGIATFPYERVVKLTAESKTELYDTAARTLYIEIFGRQSNMFICDAEDIIIAPLKPQGMDTGSKRILLSKMPYTPPDNPDKVFISDVKALTAMLSRFEGGNISDYLAANIAGLSRASAAHVVLSFAPAQTLSQPLSAQMLQAATDKLHEFDKRFDDISNLSPCISVSQNGIYKDFFAFKYHSTDKVIDGFSTLNSCMDIFFSSRGDAQKLFAASQSAKSKLNALIKKCNKKIATLSARLDDSKSAELYKKYGEILTSNLYLIPQKATTVTLPDYYSEHGDSITIPLQAELSPSKNAQRYYKLYRKLTNGAEITQQQLDAALKQQQYLYSVETFLLAAQDEDTLHQILQELTELNPQKPNKRETKGKNNRLKGTKPHKTAKQNKSAQNTIAIDTVQAEGFNIYVGKNNMQNDYITFRLSKPEDIWLHVKDYHGAHVLIVSGGKAVPNEVIYSAAQLAAKNSQAAAAGKAFVDYCLKKHVKKAPGAALGQVYYTNQSTIAVDID